MPTLREKIAEKKAEERVRINPEIDAKLDRFIQEKPDLHGYYNELSKEQLIRKLMLAKMTRSEQRTNRNAEVLAWVEQRPEVKAAIEQRIRNVPAEIRQRAFINTAKSEVMKEGMRGPRV
ncbi:MAG: hypothetical protein ABI222_08810 [Opitutaceae bacterium]